jgi:hypothetical protein
MMQHSIRSGQSYKPTTQRDPQAPPVLPIVGAGPGSVIKGERLYGLAKKERL